MKWYNSLALALAGSLIGFGISEGLKQHYREQIPTVPTELAQIVREKGKRWGVNYTRSKELQDGTEVHVTFADINQNGCKERNDRLEIRVTPKYDDASRHLPFGYEVTDWGCDGINIGNKDFPVGDDFRMYLGPDHWHHTHVGVQERDTRFEPVVQAGIKPMYRELVRMLVQELK